MHGLFCLDEGRVSPEGDFLRCALWLVGSKAVDLSKVEAELGTVLLLTAIYNLRFSNLKSQM